jgi:hypothetical protein
MPFKDYTLREKEIDKALHRGTTKKGLQGEYASKYRSHIPARLRGEPMALVEKLRKLHKKCSYIELLRHYCPVEVLSTLL